MVEMVPPRDTGDASSNAANAGRIRRSGTETTSGTGQHDPVPIFSQKLSDC